MKLKKALAQIGNSFVPSLSIAISNRVESYTVYVRMKAMYTWGKRRSTMKYQISDKVACAGTSGNAILHGHYYVFNNLLMYC
mmetsp:Transcript_18444/g.38041  ORF Transcript_18444/g.38041 Transcript_18444/m.38041 type:complete len:82 (-) Transcript_18444:92-337(-)